MMESDRETPSEKGRENRRRQSYDRFLYASGIVIGCIWLFFWFHPWGHELGKGAGFAIMLPFTVLFSFWLRDRRQVVMKQRMLLNVLEHPDPCQRSGALHMLMSDPKLSEGLGQWHYLKTKKLVKQRRLKIMRYWLWTMGVLMLVWPLLERTLLPLVPLGVLVIWTGFLGREVDLVTAQMCTHWKKIDSLLPQAGILEELAERKYTEAEKKYGKKLAAFTIFMMILFLAFVAIWIRLGLKYM